MLSLSQLTVWVLAIAATVEAGYTTVQSKYNESHAIRIKKHADGEICNGGGDHYTGWADIGERHMFYWYHPVRHGKEQDAPLMIWLQGGPGASSMMGMFILHGPCLVNSDGKGTTFNPHAWTEEFNVLYLDQPAGVGFSYVDDYENEEAYPRRTEESAHEFLATVNLVLEGFPQLKNTSFFLAGESYGGRYVPIYGAAILDWNAKAEQEQQIPLVSVLIGDGWTSPTDQYPAIYEVGCFEVDGIAPMFNSTQCTELEPIVARCETLEDACVAFPDEIICRAASDYCMRGIIMPIEVEPYNPYDRTVVCDGECYAGVDDTPTLLNSKEVQAYLEIEEQAKSKAGNFEMASEIIMKRYTASGDFGSTSIASLEKIINDETVDVLIYVGLNDWIVSALGTKRMLDRMRFNGYVEFRGKQQAPLPWKTKEGEVAGTVKKIDGLWLVEVKGAGHLVPHDQPHSALMMVKTWKEEVLANKYSAVRKSGKQEVLGQGVPIHQPSTYTNSLP